MNQPQTIADVVKEAAEKGRPRPSSAKSSAQRRLPKRPEPPRRQR